MDQKRNILTVWEVFEKYADIRDELEDILMSFDVMKDDIETALDDISDGLDQLTMNLKECDRVFRRFRAAKPSRHFFMDSQAGQDPPVLSYPCDMLLDGGSHEA